MAGENALNPKRKYQSLKCTSWKNVNI